MGTEGRHLTRRPKKKDSRQLLRESSSEIPADSSIRSKSRSLDVSYLYTGAGQNVLRDLFGASQRYGKGLALQACFRVLRGLSGASHSDWGVFLRDGLLRGLGAMGSICLVIYRAGH